MLRNNYKGHVIQNFESCYLQCSLNIEGRINCTRIFNYEPERMRFRFGTHMPVMLRMGLGAWGHSSRVHLPSDSLHSKSQGSCNQRMGPITWDKKQHNTIHGSSVFCFTLLYAFFYTFYSIIPLTTRETAISCHHCQSYLV